MLVDPLLGVGGDKTLPATSSQLPATCDCRSSSANTLRRQIGGCRSPARPLERRRASGTGSASARTRAGGSNRNTGGWPSAKPSAPSPHLCDQRRVGPSQRLLDLGERVRPVQIRCIRRAGWERK